ncbi:glycerate kinase [Candidatus Marinimicrobia bacterium]|nr:glycerate kinase [Candidatus Neomarinimicrobiota bacterium]
MHKRILVIPDSFKDSISSNEFCNIAKTVIQKIDDTTVVDCIPIGDGGEGSLESFKLIKDCTFKTMLVNNPINELVKAKYCINKKEKTGIIELAQASGIQLVAKELRNPTKTTSYGTGELIAKAISDGMVKIILFIGGSATNDVGIGMLDALGFFFSDSKNKKLKASVKNLSKISKIGKSPIYDNIKKIKFIVACDVDNPLIGPNGATQIFGKQKGASDEEIYELEEKVIHFSKIVTKELKTDYTRHKGAGAAGGVGFAALSFFNAEFEGGFELISKLLNLKDKIKKGNYDYIITGEGCIDEQTQHGKLIKHLGLLGLKYSTPVIAFTGKLKKDLSVLNLAGVTVANQITPENISLISAIKNTSKNLDRALMIQMSELLK